MRDYGLVAYHLVCVCLLFDISLHAARRAMPAACRCPRRQQRFSNTPLNMTKLLSPTAVGHTGATLSPPSDHRPTKEKVVKGQRKKTKERCQLGRAGPILLALLPRDLISIPAFTHSSPRHLRRRPASHPLPQPPDLRSPCPILREKVVARLPPTTVAPPARPSPASGGPSSDRVEKSRSPRDWKAADNGAGRWTCAPFASLSSGSRGLRVENSVALAKRGL